MRRRPSLRSIGAAIFCFSLLGLGSTARAQMLTASAVPGMEPGEVRAAPRAAPTPENRLPGTISGSIKDLSGAAIAGATVTLVPHSPAAETISTRTGLDGSFLLGEVSTGPYTLTVVSEGMESWSTSGTLRAGEDLTLPEVALSLPPANAAVEVSVSRSEIAAAQLGFEEKQRVLGVIPNFYATYIWDAAPLTRTQKFSLALRFAADPVAIMMSGMIAGSQQAENSFKGYGQGTRGYAKRFGATYADGFNSTMIGQAILPSIFHQDPRYFVKGTGTIRARAMYAIATTVICRGDSGKWQVNYSNILGNVASAGVSNIYYPSTSRHGAGLTVETALLTTASGAIGGLFQEFLLHRMTPNIPDYKAR